MEQVLGLIRLGPSVCAVGRWIIADHNRAGLDWRTPCDADVVEIVDFGEKYGEFGFCAPHSSLVFQDLAEALLPPEAAAWVTVNLQTGQVEGPLPEGVSVVVV